MTAWLFLWGWACTAGDKDTAEATVLDDCFSTTPQLEIGQGERDFEPFESAEAIMVHGPQGGWHVLGSLRFQGMEPIVEVLYQITHLESGSMVSDNSYRVAMIETAQCEGYYPGMYGYLSVIDLYDGELDTPPELLAGDMLRMDFQVTDCLTSMAASGVCDPEDRIATASMEVRALLDPIDQETNTEESD